MRAIEGKKCVSFIVKPMKLSNYEKLMFKNEYYQYVYKNGFIMYIFKTYLSKKIYKLFCDYVNIKINGYAE